MVECDWLYLPEVVAAAERGEVSLDKSVELFDRVNRQDFEACERCQPAMSSRVYRDGGVLVPTEHHIGAFHGWLSDMVTVADPVRAEQDNPGARNPGSVDDPAVSTAAGRQRAADQPR